MIGQDYEQFVRAVLTERLRLEPEQIRSLRSPGATLRFAPELQHQIDLMYIHDSEVAEYVTIIECKYRSSGQVDQPDLQNLAFVRESVRAHKAMMVTNNGFTAGAMAVADSQKIALIVVDPRVEFDSASAHGDSEELFRLIQSRLRESSHGYDMTVVLRLAPDPSQRGSDIVDQLLSDPTARRALSKALESPEVRDVAERVARDNPDLARKARDILGGRRW